MAWKNRSYLHKIHLVVLWHLSPVCMCYPNSVSFIEFFMDFCIYDEILNTICITDKKLLHFELSKSSQILSVDKTGFPRPGQILLLIFILHFPIMLAILALCLMLSITLYAGIIGRSLYVVYSYVYCCYIIVIQHEKIWLMHK